MIKKFKDWLLKKEQTDSIKISPQFKKREIWWVRVGENIGSEQSGKGANFLRPVLILCKFNKTLFWGVPLTKSEKSGKFYFTFSFDQRSKSTAILSQLKLFDARRLEEKMGNMPTENFTELKKAIHELMDDF